MFFNVECPKCNSHIRVQPWQDGKCGSCGIGYEWGDDGDDEPEIYFPYEEGIDPANDDTELEAAAA